MAHNGLAVWFISDPIATGFEVLSCQVKGYMIKGGENGKMGVIIDRVG